MSEASAKPARSLRGRVLRILGTALVLWLVATHVPWKDRLTLGERQFAGEIIGDWKSEAVRFRFEARATSPANSELAGTPAASALRLGGEVEVDHDGLESLEWFERSPGEIGTRGEETRARLAIPTQWRPGLPRVFKDLDWSGLLPAVAFAVLGTLFAVTRWWRLLALAGCARRWVTALRLTYIGLFFNLVLPGLNGGDLARAVLVVRDHPDRRADALMSVIVDRAIGLFAMLSLSATVVFSGGAPFAPLRLPVGLGILGFVVASVLFLNPPLRRWLRFEHWVTRLPQGERLLKLDRALRDHLHRPGEAALAFLLSIANHLCVAAQIWTIGHALGDELSYFSYLGVVTIANIISSLPATPGGIGVGEAAYGSLFVLLGSLAGLGVATSLTYRLTTALLGLAGGVFLLLPGGRGVRRDLARASHEDVEASPLPE